MTALAIAPGPAATLTRREAERITAELVDAAEHLQDLVVRAYTGRVWVAYGLPSWEAYCRAHIRLPKLPTAERKALSQTWRAAGMPNRASAAAMGVSEGTTRNDVRGSEAEACPVIGLDGKRYAGGPNTEAVRTAAPAVPKTQRAVLLLLAAEGKGLTWFELGRKLGVQHGSSSAILTALDRQRRAVRTDAYRSTTGVAPSAVYVHPAWA